MQVLAGSYFSVAGAFLGLIRSGRMSLFGVMLIILGIAREVNFGKHAPNDPSKEVCMYRSMYIAVLSAFFSIRGDVRKLIRCSKVKHIIHPLRHSKAKRKWVDNFLFYISGFFSQRWCRRGEMDLSRHCHFAASIITFWLCELAQIKTVFRLLWHKWSSQVSRCVFHFPSSCSLFWQSIN